MSLKEGVKDLVVGILVIILAAIIALSLILLWPFIAVVGWVAIMLLFVAIAILMAFGLVLIVGKLVRGSYGKKV